MKIQITTGCTSGGIDVDGECYMEMSTEDKEKLHKKITDALLTRLNGYGASLSDVLEHVYHADDSEQIGDSCEQCGDTVYVDTYILDDIK